MTGNMKKEKKMNQTLAWMLAGDVSVQYQVHKYLINSGLSEVAELQKRIETEGFGAALLSKRTSGGHWGKWFYQPKWTSTHYTLTDLKNLGMPPSCAPCREMVSRAFDECQLPDGGINFAKTLIQSDVCVDGMILDYAAWFSPDDRRIEKLAEYILSVQNDNGGFGWDLIRRISDPHTTVCVLEGFLSYKSAGFTYLLDEVREAEQRAIEYLLSNRLFIEDDKRYRQLSYPFRYRYDLLRALDYFARAGKPFDDRIAPALTWLISKRTPDGLWPLENMHKGNVHLIMESLRNPSRFLTLKALFILNKHLPEMME
jgi:hypothetical protein